VKLINHRYGAGSGQIWLDEVQCSGTETNIAHCEHNGWGSHDCEHANDVSVSCVKGMINVNVNVNQTFLAWLK